MKRLNLVFLLFGIFLLSYIGLTLLLKSLNLYNIYLMSILKFLNLIVIPILFLKWNKYVSLFRYATILLIIINFSVLFIELISGNAALYMLAHHLMPIPIILFLILSIMSHEQFVYGSRVTAFISIMSLILMVRFNGMLAMIMYAQDHDVILGLFRIDNSLYFIISIIIYILNVLVLDAVYEEKMNNWK